MLSHLLFGVRMALYLNSIMVLIPRWSAATAAAALTLLVIACVFTVAPTPFLMDTVTHAEQNMATSSGAQLALFSIGRCTGATFTDSTCPASHYQTASRGLILAPLKQGRLQRCRWMRIWKSACRPMALRLPGMETRVVDGELELRGPSVNARLLEWRSRVGA